MDTSKEYILMCEKAVCVQNMKSCKSIVFHGEGRNFQAGDFYYKEGRIMILGGFDITESFEPYSGVIIWLPRQDQLQDIVRLGNETSHEIVARLYRWSSKNFSILTINYSMEQLWLAFVMKEKYNKRWNGKDWEVLNERYCEISRINKA